MNGKKYAAIILSAGKGARMNSAVPKQYLKLEEKPVLYYSLLAFEKSMVEEIIVVTAPEDIGYCQKEIIEQYGIQKVKAVVAGGKERYHSVFSGLQELWKEELPADYVMIHDGARPFVDSDIILRCAQSVVTHHACAAGMPVKDTVKIADEELFAAITPNRKNVWLVQTPQAFELPLIYHAYAEVLHRESCGEHLEITDDAMAVEVICGQKVKLVEGAYRNIKITTPEDLQIAGVFGKKV